MRTLLLFRGAPGCGKSTYIDNHGLRPYALSADDIRLQCQSAQQNIYGEEEISQSNDKLVWKILFDLLETRMSKGEFTAIDATNSKTSEMNQYKKLAQDYRYRVYLIDFTDLPIEECKRRNAQRISLKRVPEAVIDKMYARFQNQSVPSMITVIKPDELNKIFYHRIDMSQYDKIVHIGDIHGCNTALQDYFKEHPFSDNNFYIFVGDYIDRGIENAKVLKFLFTLVNKKNVLFLEGNHERWLWYYAHDKASKSREFEFDTRRQLEDADIDKKDICIFYRKLAQCAWYAYKDKEVFVTHGGVATLPENLTTMATEQMIKGVGRYGDYETVADTWMSTTKNNQYEVFGHRNIKHLPIELRDRVMCLEGQVEFGGDLRVTELDNAGFHSIYVKNTVFRTPEESKVLSEKEDSSVANAVMKFRANPKYIEEKNFGSISSFNFTEDAFKSRKWDEQTVKARGLYIDIEQMKVAARGFDKFFNIGEVPSTEMETLQFSLHYPVTAYVKENGFLGLISYPYETNDKDLFITTKSTPEGIHAKYLKDMLYSSVSETTIANIKKYCKENNVTLLFEYVDTVHDPHIIEYETSNLYLLAIVKNELKYEALPYEEICGVAKNFGFIVKKKAATFNNWTEFYTWYEHVTQEDYTYNGKYIEGFVIEDATGFQTKLKLFYYNYWKYLRSVAWRTFKYRTIPDTSSLYDATQNNFYAFCQSLYDTYSVGETKEERYRNRCKIPRDIVTLRSMFYNWLKRNG